MVYTICLALALFCVGLALQEWRVAEGHKEAARRTAELILLTRELNVAASEDEFWLVVEGELPLPELRRRLVERKKILWSHARNDCRYFSGSAYLKCAVNPSESCEGCRWFEVS